MKRINLGQGCPLRHSMRAISPASTVEHTPGKAKPSELNKIKNIRIALDKANIM